MDHTINQSFAKRLFGFGKKKSPVREVRTVKSGTLAAGEVNREYQIKDVITTDSEMKSFLFSLGCFAGEHITIISQLSDNYVVSVKDARYSIDTELAEAILV